ncbi:MAG TPA: type 4a pilus biogenesis protein PilO [Sedimentisphaerales bacterium]|nr:type 4a pilus biogenesis protein PilO [Sedimentisphaerales bacterium]
MNYLRERQQLVIITTAILFVCGFVFLRYLPLNKKIVQIRKMHQEQLSFIKKAAEEKAKIAALQEERDSVLYQLKDYDRNIPVGRDLGGFLQEIADMMNAAEVVEQLVEPGQEIKGEKLLCIPVNMQCKGRFEQIFSFYQSLKNIGRQIHIEDVMLTNIGGYDGLVQMQTRAVVYYRGQPG